MLAGLLLNEPVGLRGDRPRRRMDAQSLRVRPKELRTFYEESRAFLPFNRQIGLVQEPGYAGLPPSEEIDVTALSDDALDAIATAIETEIERRGDDEEAFVMILASTELDDGFV